MIDDRIPHHPVPTTVEPFDALGLSEPILNLIREVGFEHPTPIQAAVIPPALRGRDIIALAQPGSGKTAAFVIPLGFDTLAVAVVLGLRGMRPLRPALTFAFF